MHTKVSHNLLRTHTCTCYTCDNCCACMPLHAARKEACMPLHATRREACVLGSRPIGNHLHATLQWGLPSAATADRHGRKRWCETLCETCTPREESHATRSPGKMGCCHPRDESHATVIHHESKTAPNWCVEKGWCRKGEGGDGDGGGDVDEDGERGGDGDGGHASPQPPTLACSHPCHHAASQPSLT